jgi:ApaG protein
LLAYQATTDEVTVSVRPVYLDGQSDALARRFTFAYFVRVENDGLGPVRLLRRRWLIRDGSGRVQEVEGDGVVGRQPRIAPGRAHDYHSFCVLESMTGTMEGTYEMERADGSTFQARIPRFHLRANAN